MAGKTTNRGVKYGAEVLTTVKEIRAEHHACTAREIGRRLRETHTVIGRQLRQLQKWGYVDWTEMDGSIVVTLKGGTFIKAVESGRVTEFPQQLDAGVVIDDTPGPRLVGPKDDINVASRRL